VIVKGKQRTSNTPSLSLAGYLFMGYWLFCAVVYLTIDLFIDLYTDYDYPRVFWCTAIMTLPLAACTVYLARKSLLTNWYTYIISPLIIYGLYLMSAYFTVLKLDLLISASIEPETEQVLPVKNVQRVFARKSGFIHTDVTLRYQQQLIYFEGTRTSYFFLKSHREIQANIGQSHLGNYYVTQIHIPSHERWVARQAYLKDWLNRYYWLFIGLALLIVFGRLKDKFFPAAADKPMPAYKPYSRFIRVSFIITASLFGLFMLVVLLLGLFG
jgi:hypothetical protein